MKRIFNNIVVKFVIITLLFFLFTSRTFPESDEGRSRCDHALPPSAVHYLAV